MDRFSNDTTLTRLGDHYHYLIALEECLKESNKEETIYLKQRGDVATNRKSIEVKHHHDPGHSIGDRHIDFWKTMRNYVENFSVIKEYDELILLTTSKITSSSRFQDWNSMRPNQKLRVLEEIVQEDITETIKSHVQHIFNFTSTYGKTELLLLVSKFKIIDRQPRIKQKVKEMLKREFFKPFPGKNKQYFLDELLGFIISKARDNPKDWKIAVSEFNYFVEMNARNYTQNEVPIPDLFRDIEVDSEHFKGFKFISELKEIDLASQVKTAANNYFRAQKTAAYLVANDPIVPGELSYYQDNIILEELILIKSECELQLPKNYGAKDCIKQSKMCFLQAMRMPLKNVKGYDPNHEFFQRGTIHAIVNSPQAKFSWKFEDLKNEL